MTVDEVKSLVDMAIEAGLSGSVSLAALPIEEVAAKYNGIGPAWMREELRAKLSRALKFHAPACVIHDVIRFEQSDGTSARFNEANDELERNGLILADHCCAWYNPMRYWHRHGAHLIAATCRIMGWSAWMDAYKARAKQQ